MGPELKDRLKRVIELREESPINVSALVDAIDEAFAMAAAEVLDRSHRAGQLAREVTERQVAELAALYGPTSFSRAHLDPALVATVIERSAFFG